MAEDAWRKAYENELPPADKRVDGGHEGNTSRHDLKPKLTNEKDQDGNNWSAKA